MPATDDRPLTISDLEARLNLDRSSIYRYIKDGRLQAWKTPGGSIRVDPSEVERITRPVGDGGPFR